MTAWIAAVMVVKERDGMIQPTNAPPHSRVETHTPARLAQDKGSKLNTLARLCHVEKVVVWWLC